MSVDDVSEDTVRAGRQPIEDSAVSASAGPTLAENRDQDFLAVSERVRFSRAAAHSIDGAANRHHAKAKPLGGVGLDLMAAIRSRPARVLLDEEFAARAKGMGSRAGETERAGPGFDFRLKFARMGQGLVGAGERTN
jgi:hypothetical protein